METHVKLWLSETITPAIKKEVRDLTKMNTPDKSAIKIIQDEINDHLLIIRFHSYKGKSDEVAGQIIKSYALYLSSYSHIAVSFLV